MFIMTASSLNRVNFMKMTYLNLVEIHARLTYSQIRAPKHKEKRSLHIYREPSRTLLACNYQVFM